MWQTTTPVWELILRAVLVYAFLLVVLRLTSKRQIANLTSFDLVLLVVMSNAVQNSLNAGDNSFTAGVISATVLVTLNAAVAGTAFRHKRLEAFIEGEPQILIRHGQVFERALARARLTRHELHAALRTSGCATADEVDLAMLENNGVISVIARKIPREGS